MEKISKLIIGMLLLCCPFVHVTAMQQKVIMGGQYNDPDNEDPPFRRSPIAPICVWQEEYLLTFGSSLVGEEIEVLQEGTLLCTIVIGENGQAAIPDSISGEVELRLVLGRLIYYAEIEL